MSATLSLRKLCDRDVMKGAARRKKRRNAETIGTILLGFSQNGDWAKLNRQLNIFDIRNGTHLKKIIREGIIKPARRK